MFTSKLEGKVPIATYNMGHGPCAHFEETVNAGSDAGTAALLGDKCQQQQAVCCGVCTTHSYASLVCYGPETSTDVIQEVWASVQHSAI